MRRVVVSLVVLASVLVAAPTQAADLPRLVVEPGDDAAITDTQGREVILRGINVNQLGDYFQADPAKPTTIPLTEGDFADIARTGFGVVRLTFSWSSFQPERGAFDRGALERVRQAVGWAKRHGLYVVLDMHQDSWGKDVATPRGTSCPPGLGPAVGWDGAPRWATFFDGMSTCRAADTRELSPAVTQAFQNFYLDREGIQTELVRTWARIAEAFAAEPAVAGYDLLNEPHPGFLVGPNQSVLLGRFYARAIEAIRVAERGAAGGFAHPVFFEPSVTWDAIGDDALPPPGFTPDRQIVFSPHLYAESLTLDQKAGITAASIEQGFAAGKRGAESYGAPLWSGEWAFFAEPPERDLPRTERYVRAEDSAGIGGAYWVWKQACGDPHLVGFPGASGALNRLACPGDRPQGQFAPYTRLLGRAAPRYVPGRLTALSSDAETGHLTLRGRDENPAGSCRLEVWIPERGAAEPALSATNVEGLKLERRPGGWLASGCARGAYELRAAPGAAAAPTKPATASRICRSRRTITIRLRVPKAARLRRVTVRVGTGRARTLRGNRRSVRVDLRSRAAQRVTVRLTAVARDGRRFSERRRYRTCARRG